MQQILISISFVIILLLVAFLTWRLYRVNKYSLALVLIVALGLGLRIMVSLDTYVHPWDERYHALVAKNMIQSPLEPKLYKEVPLPYDPNNWSRNHVWLHKQPMTLWMMAASMKVFGVSEFSIRIPSILLSTLAVYLTFLIGAQLFGKRIGLLAAFLHSIHGLSIELTSGRIATDHVDLIFMCLIELAIFFAIRHAFSSELWKAILTGFVTGLAILVKWLPALIVFVIWFLLILSKSQKPLRKSMVDISLGVFICFITFIPWQAYTFLKFPDEFRLEQTYTALHITEALEDHEGPIYYHFDKLRMQYGEIIYIPLLWFFYLIIRRKRDLKLWAIGLWFLVPYVFFTIAATKMPAYTVFAAPTIFIIAALFWWMLFLQRNNLKRKWLGYIVLGLLILLPIRYSLERVKPFQQIDPIWSLEIKELSKINTEHSVLFNVDRPIELMFYSDGLAYDNIPSLDEVEKCQELGYKVIIMDDGNLPEELKEFPGVTYLML